MRPFFFKYQLHFLTQFPAENKYCANCSIPLCFVCVRMLFKFTQGILKVGLTEDVCSSESKSPSPPHCHLSLSYYTPTFTMLALKHRAPGQLDLLISCDFFFFFVICCFSSGDGLKMTNNLVNASQLSPYVDYPALQGVEIHPICRPGSSAVAARSQSHCMLLLHVALISRWNWSVVISE